MKGLSFVSAVLMVAGGVAQSATFDFTYTGGIVSWVAPETTTYRVTAEGAQGAAGDPDFAGGLGALVAGDFDLIAGSMYFIAVGGAGIASDPGADSGNGGGGGGTFFVGPGDTALLIAGGGGGTRASVSQNGTDASITEAAYTGSGGFTTYTPVLKTTDIGFGGIVSSSSWGSGGAGFFGDGADDGTFGTGGSSWANGLAGGSSTTTCSGGVVGEASGGFGGGGAGFGCWGGGGGGGYSGGDGGRVAGGGGSFNSGASIFAAAGVGYGDGFLRIEYDGTMPAVPLPAGGLLLTTAFCAFGFLRRRTGAKT